MKKLLYSILALAGVVATSCTQEHIDVQYIPENAVAPTLGAIEGCDLSEGGADIVVEYTKADFGVATANVHNLYIAKTEDMADMKKAKATFTDTTITLTQADINVVALDFAEAGSEVDLYFAVVANLNTDKGAAVAGTDLRSNVVKATFKSYVADVLPSEKFDKMYVVGTINGWDHATVAAEYDFLYNYDSSNTNLYAGIIDLRTPESAAEFKFTDAGGWGSKEHSMTGTNDAEASTVTLVAGGGDNINVWQTKRFYGAELDLGGLTLKKLWSADQIGIIGLNGDWNNDVVMEYNAKWTRFYADVDIAADGTLKFRADAAWDLNWGADAFGLEGDADGNIKVTAGKYRVYFNPVAGIFELNAKNYGTEEDTGANGGGDTPEPEPTETTYGLIGSFNGWAEPDVDLVARGDGWYVVKEVVIPDAEENKFLIRLNDAWSNKFGFAEDNTYVTIDAKNTLTAEGKDMWITDGTFDFYFNPTSAELYVMTAGAADPTLPQDAKAVKFYADVTATGWTNCNIYGWGDLGDYAGGWPGTAIATETVDGKEYYAYTFDASAWGKTVSVIFNNGTEQTVDIKDIVLDKDYIFTLTDKASGNWEVTINGEAPVTPEPPAELVFGLVGTINGWSTPDLKFESHNDSWLVYKALSLTAADEFKIRANEAWDVEYGAAGDATFEVPVGEMQTLVAKGKNLSVEADGSYDIYFNTANFALYVVAAGSEDPTAGATDTWSVIGDFQSGNWSSDVVFVEAGDLLVAQDVVFANANNEGLAFKVRKNYSWNTSYGVTDTTARELGAAIVLDGGSNIFVNGEVGVAYDVYFRISDMTIWVMADGATPAI